MENVVYQGYIEEETKALFETLPNYHFSYYDKKEVIPEEVLKNCDIAIGNLTKQQVEQMPNLKWVQLTSAGVEHMLWLPKEIVLSNAYGAYGKGISEYMLACALSIYKSLPRYEKNQREHLWEEYDSGYNIDQLHVLSIGMGSIGSAFLERMARLGATCYGVKRTLTQAPSYVKELYTLDALDAVLPQMDILGVSLPATQETNGILNKERLLKCKKDAILINVGRANAIVTSDLIDVMQMGYFKGVYLDVFDYEPLPKNNPLWNQERLYITPHISGRYTSHAHYQNVIAVLYENLKRHANKEDLLHVVDRTLGY
ncbi:MAG: D-2-hydroxyacid dehydrogenase [Solobacterium sp.]|nr:D-2-hydroxyacid dehydrogenase [Solobacterium sp.]